MANRKRDLDETVMRRRGSKCFALNVLNVLHGRMTELIWEE